MEENPSTTSIADGDIYRIKLPPSCISFSSENGKRIFTESFLSGYANIYFPLAEQFRTQDDIGYSGLSTLVMILNALSVDPKRVWKGVWRWYHEDMLDCCFPREFGQQGVITVDQFARLSVCNDLDLSVNRIIGKSLDGFRRDVKKICASNNKIITCSYTRCALGQVGRDHFSPIGAYHPNEDLILILDVERYKYHPHWVKLSSMWKAMKIIEYLTGLPRGYIIMQKSQETPLCLFRLSTEFRVTLATHNLIACPMAAFISAWKRFLYENEEGCKMHDELENTILDSLEVLNGAIAVTLTGQSVFTTKLHSVSELPSDYVESVKGLLVSLESTDLFKFINLWLTNYKANDNVILPCEKMIMKRCKKKTCRRFNEMERSLIDIEEIRADEKVENHCSKDKAYVKVGCEQKKETVVVNGSHSITLLLLCWPYETEVTSPFIKQLIKYIKRTIANCDTVLQNEVQQLNKQIQFLIRITRSDIADEAKMQD